MPEEYYTTHEVSKFCNVYPTTVINWINDGILPAFTTPGGHRRIKKEDLVELMKKNNMPLPEELKGNNKYKILVIDDDVKILKLIRTILETEPDLEIIAAKSGFEGGLIINEIRPDIILLDFLMPEIDGFEITKRLKEDAKTKNIPIIAVTLLRDQKEIKKMYACGITDYLAKPFKAAELIEKIRKYAEPHEIKR